MVQAKCIILYFSKSFSVILSILSTIKLYFLSINLVLFCNKKFKKSDLTLKYTYFFKKIY